MFGCFATINHDSHTSPVCPSSDSWEMSPCTSRLLSPATTFGISVRRSQRAVENKTITFEYTKQNEKKTMNDCF